MSSVRRLLARRSVQAYLYILPGFLIYGIFVLLPILNTFYNSFFDWKGFGAAEFIGFENYATLLHDQDFWNAFTHNFFFVIFYTIIPILIGLFLTGMMTRTELKGFVIYRVGLFLPQVMSAVVVGVIWRWLFAFDGPVNQILTTFGLGDLTRPWLGDFTYARLAVGVVGTWVQYGLVMVLFIAGAQSIDESLYDSARVFGANLWQEFYFVTLPGLRQQILVAFILTFIAALRLFDLVFVLTRRGGPGTETTVVSLLIYEEAFQFNNAGYASTMAVVLSVIILAVSTIVIQSQFRRDRLEGLS